MQGKRWGTIATPVMAGLLLLPSMSFGGQPKDFGEKTEDRLIAQSEKLFGFNQPLAEPADVADVVPRELASAQQRQLLAGGLQAEFVARNVANLADMIAFWPNDTEYTHLVVCIEQGRSGVTPAGNGGLNAAVQRVNVATGAVETILHGMSRCDGIRTTPWGTILATEESDDGRAYEILDPLGTTGHWVADRTTGDVRDGIDAPTPSTKVAQRQALPTMAWEGLAVLPSGVVVGGDELRPGDDGLLDADGGAIFKFVPSSVSSPAGGPIANLSQSPLVAGRTYAMQISCQSRTSGSFPQYGQGCEVGEGAWVEIDPLNARPDASAKGATGYYRPEDLHDDPEYAGPGARFCWTNTGNSGASHFAEVMCAIDESPLGTGDRIDARTSFVYLEDESQQRDYAVVTANRFVEGDARFNSQDNLAFQPSTGNLYVIEDDSFGEVYACLPDGGDRDLKSDGCLPMLSVADPSAEPTGFVFDGTGRVAFYNVQHGQQPASLLDLASNPVDGKTDDLIRITGFKLPKD